MSTEPSLSVSDESTKTAAERPETVSALERGLDVIRCFSVERPVLGHADIARATGIPRPTVNRIVATLVANGLVQPAATSDRFTLSAGVVSIARVFLSGLDVRAVARPHLQALAEKFGASAFLGVRDGLDMVLVEACRPRSSMLWARLEVGSRAPLHNSATGRVYLAASEPSQRQRLIDSMALMHGAEWNGMSQLMQQSILEAQETGFCLSLSDFVREINSISVALIGPTNELMALSCGGAAFLFPEERLRLEVAPHLRSMVQDIAREIGGRLPL